MPATIIPKGLWPAHTNIGGSIPPPALISCACAAENAHKIFSNLLEGYH